MAPSTAISTTQLRMGVSSEPPPEVCVSCRFGRGEERSCSLIETLAHDLLFSEGPCRLHDEIREEATRLIRRRYPFARSLEDDVASEVLLRVLEDRKLLVAGMSTNLPALRRRLREIVRNAVIDCLRKHQVITKIRCGACVNFDKEELPPGCQLPFLPAFSEDSVRNPWYGSRVDRTSDPRKLDPPCDVFEWRRPDTQDLFAEEIPGLNSAGQGRERALGLLVQGIDRLAREDASGMRAAAAIFWHYLRGKDVKTLAKDSAVSEKTVKRLLAEGRERLADVLRVDLGVEDLAEFA